MAAAAEVQDLLRFLTKDARVPLATAMSKIHELRKSNLNSADLLAKTSLPNVQKHFPDDKIARQVFNAAKRVTKKAASGDVSPNTKRSQTSPEPNTPDDDPKSIEYSLRLPESGASEEELRGIILKTNRAPLVLAFAVTLLKYTMPDQPLSSRLSLGQGNVSMNSKSKAQSLGLDSSKSAEDEGWGQGQPKVKVLGRDIPVMRRAGYTAAESSGDVGAEPPNKKMKLEKSHGSEDDLSIAQEQPREEALWGLDLEALKKSNGPLIQKTKASALNGLPVYSPYSARSYLLRSFEIKQKDSRPLASPATIKSESQETADSSTAVKATPAKKKTPAQVTAEKERALALLLQAIDLLVDSWAGSLTRTELDKRAWSWYITVRPEVSQGEKGWGQRGEVRLERILALRKR